MKAYVIIDAQNDFIDGTLGSPEAQIAVQNICDVLNGVDESNSVIYATRDTHFEDNYFNTIEGQKLPVLHCLRGTKGWKINDKIADAIASKEVEYHLTNKPTFGDTHFMFDINIEDYEEVIFMGFCTDICVISNALILKAMTPDTPIKVIANCCAGSTPEKHQAALEVMRSCHIEVI